MNPLGDLQLTETQHFISFIIWIIFMCWAFNQNKNDTH
jgi:hypothetical protein